MRQKIPLRSVLRRKLKAMSDQNNVAFLSSTLASVVALDIEHTLRKVKILLGQCSSNERLLPDMDEILVDLVQGQLKHTRNGSGGSF